MDLHQYGQIKRTNQSVNNVAREIQHQRESTRDELEELHDRIDRLTLVCEGLWKLLITGTDLTENDLARAIADLDSADGSKDGRRTPPPTTCDCGAKVNRRVKACQFCGEPAPVRSVFDAI